MSLAAKNYKLATVSGTFFRIVFRRDEENVLHGAISAQGRYHHDQQPALYMSSRPDWAWKAVDSYVRVDDPPRLVKRLRVGAAKVVDIRNQKMCRELDIVAADSDVPWQPQLANGLQPNTWKISDKARLADADGLIYTARSAPERWHLVLFRWNQLGGPEVTKG
jgi:RES domain-containing protein